jgi:high-affinity Fe2+/Pb2+ permease
MEQKACFFLAMSNARASYGVDGYKYIVALTCGGLATLLITFWIQALATTSALRIASCVLGVLAATALTAGSAALAEIARVLTLGGTALISDSAHSERYADLLRSLGLNVNRTGPFLDTFPFQYLIEAHKPKSSSGFS